MVNRSSVWLSISFDRRGQRAQQLYRAIKLAIEQGHLLPAQRLPSSRQLAMDVGCSRVTVETAYQLLTDLGYIERQQGRGSYIAQRELTAAPRPDSRLPPPFSTRGLRQLTYQPCQDPSHPQGFNAGLPELRAFPFHQWTEISRQVHHQLTPSLLSYGDPQGLACLRQGIADYLVLSRQVNCQPSQVIVLTSSQQALQLLSLMLIDEGDSVVTEALCYPGAVNAFHHAGAIICPQPIDHQGAQVPAQAAKLAYLTPGHQYPLGMTMSQARRQQWLEWANTHHSWLIEDDYDSEFHYQDAPLPTLQRIDRRQRVIYLGTFSKTLFPALRLAYMVVPPTLVAGMVKARQLLDSHTAQISQAIVSEFIHQGHFASHLRLMKTLYASRRNLLISLLEQHARQYLRILPAEGGLQLAVEYLQGDTRKVTLQATQAGVILVELAPLCLTRPVLQGWILGFAALTPDEIRSALQRFIQILQNQA